jgi:class 3 adenylate cyclase
VTATELTDARLVVLCFTDVEGSSRLWRDHPAHMPDVLDALDSVVAASATGHGGNVVKARGEGDSHFVVFPTVSGAVRAAAATQRALAQKQWPGGIEVRIRIALYAGEVRGREGDFVGMAVNRAARLRSVAHGGQVVATAAVADLAADALDDDLSFESLGRHRIRDCAGWTEVFQLCGPALPHDFPPLVTLDTGLPPIATIVMLDVVNASRTAPDGDHRELMTALTALFANAFSAADGQYLKQVGDGCLALFADPDRALAFTRATRMQCATLGVELRGALNLGRVEFAHHEPIGPAIHATSRLLRAAPAGRTVCSEVAATVLGDGDDLVHAPR